MLVRVLSLSLLSFANPSSALTVLHRGHVQQAVLDTTADAEAANQVQQHQALTTGPCPDTDVVCGPGTEESCKAWTASWDLELEAYVKKNNIILPPEVGPFPEEEDEKKLLLEVDGEAATGTALGIPHPPIAALAMADFPAPLYVKAARNIARNLPVVTSEAPGVGLPVSLPVPGGGDRTIYELDAKQRVIRAQNFVYLRRNAKLPAPVVNWCDAAYFHTPGLAARVPPQSADRERKLWHSGHILAARLGGSNTDPLNFLPQNHKSNSAGGQWWRLEMIAGRAKMKMESLAMMDAAGIPCKIKVIPTFNYAPDVVLPIGAALPPSGTYSWMPTGGTFTIELDDHCGTQFRNIAHNNINNLEKVMWKWLQPGPATAGFVVGPAAADGPGGIFGIPGNTGFRFTFDWINNPDKPTNPLMFFP